MQAVTFTHCCAEITAASVLIKALILTCKDRLLSLFVFIFVERKGDFVKGFILKSNYYNNNESYTHSMGVLLPATHLCMQSAVGPPPSLITCCLL